jgi:two-component system sensor histidine kinase FlrB
VDPLITLASLEREIGQLQALATDILAYGRPGSERTKRFSVSEALGRLAEFERHEFEEVGCSIRLQPPVDGAEPFLEMDPAKFDGMVRNLMQNAREAMNGRGSLTLAWRIADGNQVCIEVCDTGPGIEGPDPERVFAPFYSTRSEGTGLGLAIVKQIVEAAGGQITVSTEIGHGASFEIRLPAAGVAAHRDEAASTS